MKSVLIVSIFLCSSVIFGDTKDVTTVSQNLVPLYITSVHVETVMVGGPLNMKAFRVSATGRFLNECLVPQEKEIFKYDGHSKDFSETNVSLFSVEKRSCSQTPDPEEVTKIFDLGVYYFPEGRLGLVELPILKVNGITAQP